MRISKLLKQLNISFETLKSYEHYLDGFKINETSQNVSEDIVLKLLNLLKEKIHDNQINSKKINTKVYHADHNDITYEMRMEFLKNVYQNKDIYKTIVKVKWYFNMSNGGEYGFLQCPGMPDIQFRGVVVENVDPHSLSQGSQVVVSVKKNVFEQAKKVNAVKVNRLIDEKDLAFLLYHQLILEDYFVGDLIRYIMNDDQFVLKKYEAEAIEKVLILYFKKKTLTVDNVILIYRVCEQFNLEIKNKIAKIIENNFEEAKVKYLIWKETSLILPFESIRAEIIDKLADSISFDYLSKLSGIEIETVVIQGFKNFIASGNDDLKKLNKFIELHDLYNIDIDYNQLSSNQITELWRKDMIDFFPVDAVFEFLINKRIYDPNSETITEIFHRISDEQCINLFSKAHYNKDIIATKDDFELLRFFLDQTDNDLKNKLFKSVFVKSSDFLKLYWFILDYTNDIEYNNVVIYTGLLSPEDQKLFFKKLLMLIATGRSNLSITDLNKITTIDYETNQLAKDIDGVGLDYSLSVILKVINDLKAKVITSKKVIFDIIADQIKTPDEFLEITGFFDKCSGRTVIRKVDANGDEEEESYVKLLTNIFPRFATFCDGMKAINRNTNEPIRCEKSGFEFWWCENSQCYEIARKENPLENWRDFTLQDVLRILEIDYQENDYEKLLSVINRVNRFLSHLTCRKCNSILRPVRQANYAFYGVTEFCCNNENCEELNKEIYLSHCLNGHCENIIDSRDTVKCKNEGYSDHCGWYICDYCYACCSTEKINGRKYRLQITGQQYHCHDQGHLDKGIICCPKCGQETISIENDADSYVMLLNWFENNKNINPNIINYGERQDGKKWFIWARRNYSLEEYRNQLTNIKRSGFNIPNFDDLDNITQLVAEPFEPINNMNRFECPNCDHIIDLTDKNSYNYDQIKAIKSFHNHLFHNFNNE